MKPESKRGPTRTVIFHRDGGFYFLDLPTTDDLAEHARCNPGTLKISDARTMQTLWSPEVVH